MTTEKDIKRATDYAWKDTLNDLLKYCCKRYKNKNKLENEIKKNLELRGYHVLKSGWPDFLAYKNGKIKFIEVKSKGQKLSHQQELMKMLFKECLNKNIKLVEGSPEPKRYPRLKIEMEKETHDKYLVSMILEREITRRLRAADERLLRKAEIRVPMQKYNFKYRELVWREYEKLRWKMRKDLLHDIFEENRQAREEKVN